MNCNQKECTEPTAYRYTWPGKDETGICEKHVAWMRKVAEAQDTYLQIIPLEKR